MIAYLAKLVPQIIGSRSRGATPPAPAPYAQSVDPQKSGRTAYGVYPWALCNAISAAIVGIGFLIPALNEFREPSMIQVYLDMIREF